MELQEEVKRKDEEIVFLRSMLASLSEKVEQLESTSMGKLREWAGDHVIFLSFYDSHVIFLTFYSGHVIM